MTQECESGEMTSTIQYFGDEYQEISLDIGGALVITLSKIRELKMVNEKDAVHPNCRCSTVPEDSIGEQGNL